MSETIRVSPKTKEALLRVAAKLQGRLGKRVDFDEAINHLVLLEEDKDPQAFMKFVGSARKAGKTADVLLNDLARERRLDELRAKRKYGF
jgi:hypothetical protein